MAKKLKVVATKSIAHYEAMMSSYQDIYIQITKDLCDETLPCKVKGLLAGTGEKVAKMVEYLRSVIDSFGRLQEAEDDDYDDE